MDHKKTSNNSLFQLRFHKDAVLIQNILKDKSTALEISNFGAIKIHDWIDKSQVAIKTLRGYGIFGIINLVSGYYIILITEREKEGLVDNKVIYRVTKTEIEKIGDSGFLDSKQKTRENRFLANLKMCLNTKHYYFSYEYNITSSLQRQNNDGFSSPSWRFANPEFFYNRYLCEPLILASNEYPKVDDFILPITNGYFMNKKLMIKSVEISVTLITRRSRNNQGVRFFCRGVDKDGNVANFAETEQIVEFHSYGHPESEKFGSIQNKRNSTLLSLLQIRGSVPFKWAQIICGKYKPILMVDSSNSDGFIKHCRKITDEYGRIAIVNLVDKRKYENPVGLEFQRLINIQKPDNISYFHYDFHAESKRNKHYKTDDQLDKLLGDVIANFGCYRRVNNSQHIVKLQSGVVRTNCMDCLDRTNVIQSKLASMWIQQELRNYNILLPSESFDDFPQAEYILRNMWADNADFLSIAYSGTPALKTDITRTGVRTLRGMLSDGWNSLSRYYIGCYYDGFRQDSIDLFLGKYKVPTGSVTERELKISVIKNLLNIAAVLSVLLILYFLRAHLKLSAVLSLFLSPALAFALYATVIFLANTVYPHSLEYILNWPTLVPYLYSPHAISPRAKFDLPTPYSITKKKPSGKIK